MLKLLFITLLSIFSLAIMAKETKHCSPWTQQIGISCVFANQSAKDYKRQCDNPCGRYDSFNERIGTCSKEETCHFQNPDTFESVCSEWTELSGISCYNPNSQSWQQEWVRACTVNLKETWCSSERPDVD
jgi:hypothetical protein